MGIPLQSVTDSIKNNLPFSENDLKCLKKKHGDRVKNFEKHVGSPFEEVFQKEICAKLEIKTETNQKTASVSFVSFFAGLGIISEFIKSFTKIENVPMMTNLDFYQNNMFKPGFIPGPNQRLKNSECFFCSDMNIQEIFATKWGLVFVKKEI